MIGSKKPRTSIPPLRVLAVRVFGGIKTASATGAKSASRNIFPKAKGSRVSGRTQRKNAGFLEFSFFSMKKIPESFLKGSRKPIKLVSMLTPLLDTIIMLRTCLLTKSLKLTMNRSIECLAWHKTQRLSEENHLQTQQLFFLKLTLTLPRVWTKSSLTSIWRRREVSLSWAISLFPPSQQRKRPSIMVLSTFHLTISLSNSPNSASILWWTKTK